MCSFQPTSQSTGRFDQIGSYFWKVIDRKTPSQYGTVPYHWHKFERRDWFDWAQSCSCLYTKTACGKHGSEYTEYAIDWMGCSNARYVWAQEKSDWNAKGVGTCFVPIWCCLPCYKSDGQGKTAVQSNVEACSRGFEREQDSNRGSIEKPIGKWITLGSGIRPWRAKW